MMSNYLNALFRKEEIKVFIKQVDLNSLNILLPIIIACVG